MSGYDLAHFLHHALTQTLAKYEIDMFLKGCSINEEKASFSLNNQLTPLMVEEITALTHAYLARGGDIMMQMDPTTDEIFYWQYADIIIPCGGTHVKSVAELNPNCLIHKKSQGKQKCKIYIREAE